jgi:dTDP-L-rhamnose 4-epimerase
MTSAVYSKELTMSQQVLITGGAGFIGSHLADELLMHGYRVRVLDNLLPQVHGDSQDPPLYLNPNVTFIHGDICDPKAVAQACQGVDVVYHFAARVGVGQSMYEIARYTETNNHGTAVLLEALCQRPVARLVVASSMSIYGEGLYQRRDGSHWPGSERTVQQLKASDWELRDPDQERLTPVPTPETKQPNLASIYALSKYDQERMCLICGRGYEIPTVALRFFNVYGTRQALSNPYTGVLAIFATRLLNNNPPLIYEDGYQKRDFVNVQDVARACRLAMETPAAAGQVFNIGSGQAYTVREIAEQMAVALNKSHLKPEITGKYRVGDIRHCFADITHARQVLGYEPAVSLAEGITEYAAWLRHQIAVDHVAAANRELSVRGLTL